MVTVATYNIFLLKRIDDAWRIKVADFGLSENTGSKDYFRQNTDEANGAKLPVKWMAMESLEQGVFSEKTDVVGLNYAMNVGNLYSVL